MSDLTRAPAPVALVDDNVHSARLFLRTLAGNGYRARWLGNGDRGGRTLDAILAGSETAPSLVVVDLKARSNATAQFIARHAERAKENGTILVAMVHSLEAVHRNAALEAGAAAVFGRHSERAEYHREIQALLDFWARSAKRVGA